MHIYHVLKQLVIFTYLLLIVAGVSMSQVVAAEPAIGPTPSPDRPSFEPPAPPVIYKEPKYYPVKMEEVYISTEYSLFHPGLDFASNTTVSHPSIYAIQDGTVVFAEDTRYMTSPYGWGYGKLVVIEHEGGVFSLYAHLNDMSIKEGDTVKQGDEIGVMGSTGNSTGTHLHFEMFTKEEFGVLVKHDPSQYEGIQKALALLHNGQN
ncbi:M23 family metallopeptidase [Candidatus Roizmanbacteria bacterium]|nr:MAG: M23 family metallopeptidase [Candidatus Roizmanbacteria bacterium]